MNFLKSIFSEESGKGSFSRVSTFVLLLFELGWVTHLVRCNHALPDFGSLAMFISALYGINTISKTAQEYLSKPAPPAPPTPTP